ncbi:MAG: tRNA (adenine(22)-N(1))-methyltransferase [Acholeplasmataceae bacterium]
MARSRRIAFLARQTKGYRRVIDIGTDHGYVLKEAFDRYGIEHGIATDIRKNPLDQARRTLSGYPVSFYQTEGFRGITEPFDLAIIAGMGANTILAILKEAPDHDFSCLLQANGKHGILRLGLAELGYRITDEHVLVDGHNYVIIAAERGRMELSEEDRLLGPFLKEKKEAIPYFEFRIGVIEGIIGTVDREKRRSLLRELELFRNAARRLKSQ